MSVEVKIVAVDFGQLAEARAGLADGAFAAHEVDDIAVAPLGLLGVAFGFGGGLPGGFSGVEGSGAEGGCGLRAGRGRPVQGEETAESGGEAAQSPIKPQAVAQKFAFYSLFMRN